MEKQRKKKKIQVCKQKKNISIKRDPPYVTLVLSELVKWPIDYMKLVWICNHLWPSIDTCPVKKILSVHIELFTFHDNLTGHQAIMMRDISIKSWCNIHRKRTETDWLLYRLFKKRVAF